MLRKCPRHGIKDWLQVKFFYNGLNGQTKSYTDASSGGTILSKTPSEALKLFEDISMTNCQWPSERSNAKRTAGIYEVDQATSFMA